jgi:hypothetical protein
MLYLSQVLGRPILDLDGERVATLRDVIVRLGADEHPPVAGFVARYRRRDFFLSRWRFSHFGEDGVRLNSDILDLRPFMRREGEVLLARDVLDKQLIDVDGERADHHSRLGTLDPANRDDDFSQPLLSVTVIRSDGSLLPQPDSETIPQLGRKCFISRQGRNLVVKVRSLA